MRTSTTLAEALEDADRRARVDVLGQDLAGGHVDELVGAGPPWLGRRGRSRGALGRYVERLRGGAALRSVLSRGTTFAPVPFVSVSSTQTFFAMCPIDSSGAHARGPARRAGPQRSCRGRVGYSESRTARS